MYPNDINYFPAVPGVNGDQIGANAYFQRNPQMQTSGIGQAIYGGGAAGAQAPGGLSAPLGMNLGTAQLAIGGIGTLANIWNASQANKLARQQFEYQKGITDTNLANSLQSYNTALDDRIRSRAVMTGMSDAQVNDYIDKNSLRDRR